MTAEAASSNQTYDVAIVGFGPVGATLAGLLGRRGRGVAVFDKSAEIFPLPRAIGLDHEALRVLQAIARVDDLLPHTAPYRPSVYLGCDLQPILRFDIGPPPFPLGWRPNYTFNQPKLEAWLREKVTSMPTVDVKLGAEVTALTHQSDRVVLSLKGADRHTVTAKYVVGCDGSASMVRRACAIDVNDLQFDERWLVIDMLVSDQALARLPDTNIQYCQPERPSTYVVLPANHRRWEIMLNAGEDAEQLLKPKAIWRLLAGRIGPDEGTLWRAAVYRFHAIVANRWRADRCFLAGDSAHQMPPFLAQGMCQGLRDAANLEWKLDLALGGPQSQGLLDSYEAERKPNVIEVTNAVKQLGKLICERDPVTAQKRDADLRQAQGGVIETKTRQNLIPGIKAGVLSPTSRSAGDVFPQPLLRFGDKAPQMLDDLTGPCFRLFVVGAYELSAELSRSAFFRARGTSVIHAYDNANVAVNGVVLGSDLHGQLAKWFEQHNCAAAIVRPDNYVFGTAATTAEIPQLLSELTSYVSFN